VRLVLVGQFIEQSSLTSVRVLGLLLGGMRVLASKIESELRKRAWKHCAIYEPDLQRFWPRTEKDREAKIAQFATEHGFRLRF